ncbi:MAG TPA: hypothetical protein DCP90_07860 [Clostridiales bacterium]|nr:MAG: hypothetical protein A2Y22_06055 [Clostridiales bacterium GWD2_32_59]HAN10514.1 hypothetical protein [Clostridiales bacterium]
MKAQQLRNAVLQQVIQGKLVPQNPADEPASVLLERIKKEKEQLIKEGKIKKDKLLPEITDDEKPFDIPESWEWVRLGEICNYSMGKTPPRKEDEYWRNAEYNWVSIADMIADGVIIDTKEKVNQHSNDNLFKGRISKKGTLLMSFKLTVGRVSILGIDAFHNEAIISIYPFADNEGILKNYLFKTLPVLSQSGETKTAIKGNTLNSESINNLLIPLPPLEEQKRIVAKIEEIMPMIDEYEKYEVELSTMDKDFPDKLKKSILQYAVQGKIVEQDANDGPVSVLIERIKKEKEQLIKDGKIKKDKPLPEITDDEMPFEIPESWEWVRLGEITKLITKGSSPSWQGVQYINSEDGTLFITSENVGVEKLLLDKRKYLENKFNEIQPRSILEQNDILTNIVGGSIGRAAKYNLQSTTSNINQAVALIRLIKLDSVDYILKYLNSYIAYQYMMSNQVDTARANISLNTLAMFLIPLPPLEEQKRIVEKVVQLMELCEAMKAK